MTDDHRKILMNIGCGAPNGGRMPPFYSPQSWREVRLDIDPANQPDIVANFADMHGVVPDAAVDSIFSSHSIEHLYAHEVIPAFREFRRVLRPDGFMLVTCPDLVSIARYMLEHGSEAVAYDSPAGPIRPIDMLFGHGMSISRGAISMAHRTGFTAPRLARIALEAGFRESRVMEGNCFDLWAILLGPEAQVETIAPMFDGFDQARLFNAAVPAEGQADLLVHANV